MKDEQKKQQTKAMQEKAAQEQKEQVAELTETAENSEQKPSQKDDVEALRESAKIAAAQMMEAFKQCEVLNTALEQAKQEAEGYKDQLLRLNAEFDNYRKRTSAELSSARDEGAMGTLRLLLPTLDNLERAMDAAREEGSASVVQGLDMVMNKLMESFEKKGLKQMEALDQPFDPKLHEAAMQEQVEDEEKKQTVAQVLQKGYLYNGKVLRYATVKVYI